MSDSERQREEEEEEDSRIKRTSGKPQRFVQKVSKKPSIIINFYTNGSRQKIDRLIQTDDISAGTLQEKDEEEDLKINEEIKKPPVVKKEASTTISEHNFVKRENKESNYAQIIIKKLARSMSEEKKDEKPMDARKPHSDNKSGKALPAGKQASDLERKRMQAELNAAEEIAKIKQTLIEKRLALELAIIDDGVESHHKAPSSRTSHQAELRALEEIALRKQSLIETNLAQELESLDYQSRLPPPAPRQVHAPPPPQPQPAPPPRPPPPPPPPPPPQRQPSPPAAKLNPFRTESSSFVMSSLRGLGVPKLNLDKKFSGDSGQRTPNPLGYVVTCINERRYPESRKEERYPEPRREERYPESRREERYPNYPPPPPPPAVPPQRPEYAYNYAPPQEYSKARSTWKSAVSKIKKKMKSKQQAPTYDEV